MASKRTIAKQIIHFTNTKNLFYQNLISEASKIIKTRSDALCMLIDTPETDEIYYMLKEDPNVRSHDIYYHFVDKEYIEFFNEKYICGSRVFLYCSGNILSGKKRRFIIAAYESLASLYKLSNVPDDVKKKFVGADCAQRLKAYLDE